MEEPGADDLVEYERLFRSPNHRQRGLWRGESFLPQLTIILSHYEAITIANLLNSLKQRRLSTSSSLREEFLPSNASSGGGDRRVNGCQGSALDRVNNRNSKGSLWGRSNKSVPRRRQISLVGFVSVVGHVLSPWESSLFGCLLRRKGRRKGKALILLSAC